MRFWFEKRQMISFVICTPSRHHEAQLDPLQIYMQLDLQDYLRQLEEMPHLARLARLDIYDETRIEGQWLNGLIDDLSSVMVDLEAGAFQHDIASKIGQTDTADIQRDFGPEEMLEWARALHTLACKAKSQGLPLLACGD